MLFLQASTVVCSLQKSHWFASPRIVGRIIKDMRGQKFDENLQFTINVERMDQLLNSNAINIRLMKMDACRFECNILDGMGEDLANKIDVIKFEYSKTHMHGHDCLDLLKKIDQFKFLLA